MGFSAMKNITFGNLRGNMRLQIMPMVIILETMSIMSQEYISQGTRRPSGHHM